MPKKPDAYLTPLRKRADIIEQVLSLTNQRSYDYRNHPFCFNVKVYRSDFSFENLLDVYRKSNDDPFYTHDPDWLKAAREEYDGVSHDKIWTAAQESACDLVTDSDSYNHLYNGTKVDVAYSFEGRSGGWLSLHKFEGYDFTEGDIRDTLTEMPYNTLRKLYSLITMLAHDWRREAVENEIEFQAAFYVFENVCSDVPKPEATQKRLAFAEE